MLPRTPVARALAIFCLGLLAAVGLAAASLALMARIAFGPAAPVRDYIEAVRGGDGGRARALLDARIPAPNGAMLDGPALAESVRTLRSLDYDVEKTGEETAVVTLRYRLHDEPGSTRFPVHRTGTRAGLLEDWEIDAVTLPTIRVAAPKVEAVTLNGRKVGVPRGAAEFAVFFPGLFTAEQASPVLDAARTSAAVTGPASGAETKTLTLEPRLSGAARDSLDRQIRDRLDACARQNTLYPRDCPFEYAFDGRVEGSVTWRIDEYPDPAAALDDRGRWRLTHPRGMARIELRALDLYTGRTRPIRADVPFTLPPDLRVSRDELRLGGE